ncbi:MAG: excinuclease ABC subunit UvrC [Clostridia bacterium]|nr:excinuclease ABC subunit UvrC [Clostridia bacterium]
MFDLKQQLKKLPELPGVYLMHDKDDNVIYVGKAKILKNRVRQYFMQSKNHSAKVLAMVSHVAWFEYIITDSELEALVLECNLIKKYKPHYNILLKDDKHYPYIKVTMNKDYPRLSITRSMLPDGARYYGPYSGMGVVRQTVELIKKIFLIPTCKRSFPQDIGKGRPCLNYQIKKCFAPCRGEITQAEYRAVFEQICMFLDGKSDEIVRALEIQMQEAAENMAFEKAAEKRDQIAAIHAVNERQKIISDAQTDRDVADFVSYDDKAFFEMFLIRGGRMTGRQSYRVDGVSDMTDGEIMAEFLKLYYSAASYVPPEILLGCAAEDAEMLELYLSSLRGKRVHLAVPVRGEKKQLVHMLLMNINNAIDDYKISELKRETERGVLEKLAEYTHLSKIPRRIESYDISNTGGTGTVGVMVVFENGTVNKAAKRNFRIQSIEGQNDYAAMQEVIYRRMQRAHAELAAIEAGTLSKKDAKFLPLPDMMLIDGGKGHVGAVREVLVQFAPEFGVFGMQKDDRHNFSELIDGVQTVEIPKNSAPYRLIGTICEETHNTAIGYHKKVRRQNAFRSELAEIPGVGEVRRKQLLRAFKTLDAVARASVEDLQAAGLDKRSAQNVYDYYH